MFDSIFFEENENSLIDLPFYSKEEHYLKPRIKHGNVTNLLLHYDQMKEGDNIVDIQKYAEIKNDNIILDALKEEGTICLVFQVHNHDGIGDGCSRSLYKTTVNTVLTTAEYTYTAKGDKLHFWTFYFLVKETNKTDKQGEKIWFDIPSKTEFVFDLYRPPLASECLRVSLFQPA